MKNQKDMIDSIPAVLKNAINPDAIVAALNQPKENFIPVPWDHVDWTDVYVPTSDVVFGNVVKTENRPSAGCPVLTLKLHDEVFVEISFPTVDGGTRFWVSNVSSTSKDWPKELVTFYVWELQEQLRNAGFQMN